MQLVEDTPGCKHSFAGPTRSEDDKLYGRRYLCHHGVALELDATGKRTGKAWIVEPLMSESHRKEMDSNTWDQAAPGHTGSPRY